MVLTSLETHLPFLSETNNISNYCLEYYFHHHNFCMSQVYILKVFVIFELLENIEKRVFWLVMHVYCCCTLEGTFNAGVMRPVDLLSIVR